MSRRLLALACVTAFLMHATMGRAAGVAAPVLESTRALGAALARAGRAEVKLEWAVPGLADPALNTEHGVLAVEPPDRARLDISGTGERITVRGDGGEWLQPALKQLVRLTPRHAAAAMRWWRLLAGGGAVAERRLSPRHFRLTVPASTDAEVDSAEVWLDARGLPVRLALADGTGGPTAYRLSGWRFPRARGPAAFRLLPPPGIEVVEMP